MPTMSSATHKPAPALLRAPCLRNATSNFLGEAGFRSTELFYLDFAWRGWVAYA